MRETNIRTIKIIIQNIINKMDLIRRISKIPKNLIIRKIIHMRINNMRINRKSKRKQSKMTLKKHIFNTTKIIKLSINKNKIKKSESLRKCKKISTMHKKIHTMHKKMNKLCSKKFKIIKTKIKFSYKRKRK